jgi:hypothetical protein
MSGKYPDVVGMPEYGGYIGALVHPSKQVAISFPVEINDPIHTLYAHLHR